MASKKLRPGSFKGGNRPVRRTGRTTGISQSAFAGYGFQPNQQASPPTAKTAEPTAEESAEETGDEDLSPVENGQATSAPAEGSKKKADEAGGSAD